MKNIIKRQVSLLLAVITLCFSLSVGAFAKNTAQEKEFSQSDLEYFYTLKPVYSDGTVKLAVENVSSPDSAPLRVFDGTFDYKATIHLTVDFEGLEAKDVFAFGLYENGAPLIRTTLGQDKLTYTFHKVTSDREIYLKVLDPTGSVLYFYGQDFSMKFNIIVKDGFFDKFFSFFREIFGLLPEYNWSFGYNGDE